MVIVEIGPMRKRFHLPLETLSHYSDFFRTAFSGSWREAKEGIITLKDVEVSTFNLFVHWLFNSHIPYELRGIEWEEILDLQDKTTTKLALERLIICIKAYDFAERIIAPGFQRQVNDRFHQFYNQHEEYVVSERYPIITLAFDIIPHDRVILQILVDQYCTHALSWRPIEEGKNGVDTTITERYLPASFLLRALKRLGETEHMTPAERFEMRCYREHATDGEKTNCRGKHIRYDARVDFGFFA